MSEDTVNISEVERWASTFGGGLLALYGLTQRSFGGVLLAAIGGGLAYRGLSGHCGVYQQLGISTAASAAQPSSTPASHPASLPATVASSDADTQQHKLASPDDVVQEASEESMDGSDAPAWTDRRLARAASEAQAAAATPSKPLPAAVPGTSSEQSKLASLDDVVQEASEESMDGSDAPAWTDRRTGTATQEVGS